MSNLRIAAIVCFLALHSCTCAVIQLNEVVSACRRRCFNHVTSDESDVGFGDCFDTCFESLNGMSAKPIVSQPETDESVANANAGMDQKRSVDGFHAFSWSKVFPRALGSGSASKYLRIGRSWNDDGQTITAEGELQDSEVDKRKSSMAERSASLTSRLGNSAKSYLRVGKKSAEQVDV